MSGDNHGNSDGPSDIIPLGSWQDAILGLVCAAALVGFYFWAKGFVDIAQAPPDGAAHQTHAAEPRAE